MISKDSRLPLYFQLKSELERRIASGAWKAGARVPSERELCAAYSISRITVRQAIAELVVEGRLTRQQGRGTFVAQPRIQQRLTALTGFSQDIRARGQRPGSRVIRVDRVRASAAVLHALGLDGRQADVILLARLRTADGEPMAVETAYLPADRCEAVLTAHLDSRSLYEVLGELCGIVPTHAEQQIVATACPTVEARLLGVRPRSPALRITRTTYSKDGLPFEYVESFYRGDKYVFHVDLRSEPSPADARNRRARAVSNGRTAHA